MCRSLVLSTALSGIVREAKVTAQAVVYLVAMRTKDEGSLTVSQSSLGRNFAPTRPRLRMCQSTDQRPLVCRLFKHNRVLGSTELVLWLSASAAIQIDAHPHSLGRSTLYRLAVTLNRILAGT